MKRCRQCGKRKPLSEFYEHQKMADGHLNKCKACVKSRVRVHRENNLDHIRAYDRERGQSKARKLANKRRAPRYVGRYKTVKVGESQARRARVILGNAVKAGKIQRQPCEGCGSTSHIHAHHEDYLKPLDVIWLCPICHGKRHREINDLDRHNGKQ
jgi:hypothetical protein